MRAVQIRQLRRLIILLFFFFGLTLYFYFGLPGPASHGEGGPFTAAHEESCLNCHGNLTGFAPAHRPEAIGCASCHGGDPAAVEADRAHRGLYIVPGNLDNIYQTCGSAGCHADIAGRVEKSLMSTMAGVVTVDRFVFGESDSLTAYAHIEAIGQTAADQHLRHLCASCHLGKEKEHPAPVAESSRGGGCIACHLNYSEEALASLERHKAGENIAVHPAIDIRVRDDHCFGCHSRSGRISTNYQGWHETQLTAEDVHGRDGFRQLADRRVFRYVAADVHHTAGLECIDCHTSTEVMGDGRVYLHQEDAVHTRCEDCHSNQPLPGVAFPDLDLESKKILSLRPIDYEGYRFALNSGGVPLINVLIDAESRAHLVGKNTGKVHPLQPPAEICTRGEAHDALTCGACHTAWAPQCVGCHNAYAPEVTAFDLLDDRRTPGKWEEYLGEFFAEAPTLGVVEALDPNGLPVRQIKTFIPGMIMTIDKSGFPGEYQGEAFTFHRLFAPTAPHTISAGGRTCQSCHSDPLALGYGRGELRLESQKSKEKSQKLKVGEWTFSPEYVASEYDGLPQDAWTGFLQERTDVSATRPNARPFNLAEQQRILTVGACLTCHRPESEVMVESLEDFRTVWERRSGRCVTPLYR